MLHFDDAPASFRWVTTDCFTLTPFFTKICPGYVGYGRDRGILQSLGVPRIYILNWRPPDFGWYKVNIDGLSKGNPGLQLVREFSEIILAPFWVVLAFPLVSIQLALQRQLFLLWNWLIVGGNYGQRLNPF